MAPGRERIEFHVGAERFDVLTVSGHEALSELFRYEVELASTFDAPAPAALLGREAHLTLRDSFGQEAWVHGVVAEAETRVSNAEIRVVVVVRPQMFALTLGRDCRVFQDVTVVDIARLVVGTTGMAARFEITEPRRQRAYVAQYREDDYSFLSRLLEEEGIYFWFDHAEESTTVVFADRSTSAPELRGGALVPFIYNAALVARRDAVEAFGDAARAAPTRFSVASFDANRPDRKVCSVAGGGDLEVYDAPGGGPEEEGACALSARVRKERADVERNQAQGVTTSARFLPGRIVEIVDHPVPRNDGRWLVTSTDVRAVCEKNAVGSGGRELVCRFRASAESASFRPRRVTPLAKQAGLQSAVVVGASGQEVFSDEAGRVRVQMHWDRLGARDDSGGKWVRVAQRGTAASMLLPRVGWNVMTVNEEGSVDAPAVLSRVHDAEHPPAYPLPDNMTRVVFKTATTPGGGSFNEVHYEDKAGSEVMFMNAARNMSVLVRDTKQELVMRDSVRTVGAVHKLDVTENHMATVVGNQVVTVGAEEQLTVALDRTKVVKGDETATIAAKRSLETGAGHSTTVVGRRSLGVGAALIDTTLGEISAKSGTATHVLVGGARIAVSAKSISLGVKLVAFQTIGGAKIELTKKGRSIEVKNRMLETVGGAMVVTAGGAYTDSAKKTASYTVGGTLGAEAPEILVDAKEKIVLQCGPTTITIEATKVTIAAPDLTLVGADNLLVKAPRVEHNP